jgi:cbb3-type cytochrome oxidase subunit 3
MPDPTIDSEPVQTVSRLPQAKRSWRAGVRWFLAEFLVVLSGVFLALLLDAWWSRQKEAADEAATLTRLHEESEDIARYFENLLVFHDSLNRNHEAAVAALEPNSANETNLEAFRLGVFFAFTYPAINPPRSVYDEVRESGMFGRISSPKVRSSISEYYGRLDWIHSQLAFFRQTAQPGIEMTMQLPFAYDPKSDQRMQIMINPADLRGDRNAHNALIFGLRNQLAFQRSRRRVYDQAVIMCQTIAEAAGDSCVAARPKAASRSQ